jgi:hypothetical protein
MKFVHFPLAIILERVGPVLGNDIETNNETRSAAKKQILDKKAYAVVTE